MTACHVAKYIGKLDPTTKTWQLVSDTYVDFGDTTNHSASQEFVVNGITRMSSVRGFDVAVLQVELKSRDAVTDLPAKLDLAPEQVKEQIPIAVIGYPSFDVTGGNQKTIDMMSRVKAAHPNGAKYISPSAILSNEDRTLFHILVHVGSTQGGNSGSPVFSLDPVQVVGIHYCCAGPDDTGFGVPPQDAGDCSSTAAADIHSNEAISAADARAFIPTETAVLRVASRHDAISQNTHRTEPPLSPQY
jgi:hypothetical protein